MAIRIGDAIPGVAQGLEIAWFRLANEEGMTMTQSTRLLIAMTTLIALSAVSGADDAKPSFRTLTNPAKDITVVSDRDESLIGFFKRQRLVVGNLKPKELSEQFEAKEPSPRLFLSYASYNHGLGGKGHSTFGAFIRLAPVPKSVASALADSVKGEDQVMVVLRRGGAEPLDAPSPQKEPPVWEVIGYTTRGNVRLFESGQKKEPDDFSPRDLWYVEPKKDSSDKK